MTKITDKVSKKLNSLTSKPTTRSATSGPTQDNQTQGHVLDDSALIPPESGPAIQTEESGCRPGFSGDPDGTSNLLSCKDRVITKRRTAENRETRPEIELEEPMYQTESSQSLYPNHAAAREQLGSLSVEQLKRRVNDAEKEQLIDRLLVMQDRNGEYANSMNVQTSRTESPANNNLLNNPRPGPSTYYGHAENRSNNRERLRELQDYAKSFREIVRVARDDYEQTLQLFELQCTAYGVESDSMKYEILLQKWPQPDIIDFLNATTAHERNYHTLCDFLRGKGDVLPQILRPTASLKPLKKYQDLRLEATKWAKSSFETLVKFFTHHLASDEMKREVSLNFGQNLSEFHDKNNAIFLCYERRADDNARNIEYTSRNNANRNRRRDDYRGQRGQPRNHYYGGNQYNRDYHRSNRDGRANYNGNYNNNNQYNGRRDDGKRDWCELHRMHGNGAWRCGLPNTCPRAQFTTPRPQPKNELPSPNQ